MSIKEELNALGQTVLVFQGGGALGAYQAGVYQALHEAGVEPDWVIGTSIGAINAALIAGNPAEDRLDRLHEFWRRVEHGHAFESSLFKALNPLRTMAAITGGIPAFFTPNPFAFLGQQVPLGPEEAGYYSVTPLQRTLADLVDFERINDGPMRLTVGAAHVQTGAMRYFDTDDETLDARHVLASGALPPAFPAVRIDGELYWDGGIVSNTPVEAVFDDQPRQNAVVFSVHLWNPHGPEPKSIWEVANRQKDIQYASRSSTHIARQRQLHRLRHVISRLAALVPAGSSDAPEVEELAGYGCVTKMHVVRLLAPRLDHEDHTKDVDFSPTGIRKRWNAGYRDTLATLKQRPWRADSDPLEGFILHEAIGGEVVL
ncbi:MAG: patatin-like phospholipase family protein [Alphaproteobacteria bacterium]